MAKNPPSQDERFAEVDARLDFIDRLEKVLPLLEVILETGSRRLVSREKSVIKEACVVLDGAKKRIRKAAFR